MKNSVKLLIQIMVCIIAVLLIIHRRVIAAALTGDPIPEMPEWHKKVFGLGRKNECCGCCGDNGSCECCCGE